VVPAAGGDVEPAGVRTTTAGRPPNSLVSYTSIIQQTLKESGLPPYDRVMTLVTELLAAPLTGPEIEQRCRTLQEYHDGFQVYYGEQGEKNPNYARRPEFVWGAVLNRPGLPVWYELTREHFPSSPALARETREKLLLAAEQRLGPS
jgi:hypothetical protein